MVDFIEQCLPPTCWQSDEGGLRFSDRQERADNLRLTARRPAWFLALICRLRSLTASLPHCRAETTLKEKVK